MGPLQCQKRLRLTEARRLMLEEKRNVTEAALEVGYESVSQFIREAMAPRSAPRSDMSFTCKSWLNCLAIRNRIRMGGSLSVSRSS